MHRLRVLQEQVAKQSGHKVDCYYQEGYGALLVPHNYPLHPNYVIFAVPDIALAYRR
jgi:hypothetical protein